MQAPSSDALTAPKAARPGAAIFGSLAALLVALLAWRELSPAASFASRGSIGLSGVRWTSSTTDVVLGVLACAGGIGLVIGAVLLARGGLQQRSVRRAADVALITLVIASGLTWGYASRGLGQAYYIKVHDAFHYFLGPKYFKEVGYFRFYDCIAAADNQTVRLLDGKNVRDLMGYDLIRAKKARQRARCEERFSPERWQEFKADYLFFAQLDPQRIPDVVGDHGYNGTPFNAFVGGLLANAIPLSYSSLIWASLLDTLGILFAFYWLSRAVGWRWAALVALTFFTLFTDRGYFILGSFFRYHWLIFSCLGAAELARQRHARAGAFFATAGMLNVFPVLFFLGIGLKIVWTFALERTLHKSHLRFVQGALAASLVFAGLSISHAEGPKNYARFFEKMGHHADLVTRSRVGLRYDLVYRGETRNSEYSADVAEAEMHAVKPMYWALVGVLFLGMILIVRELDDLSATVLCGIAAVFYLFGTVEYYYGIYALLPLALRARAQRAGPLPLALTALPLLGSALATLIYVQSEALGIVNNWVCSYTITLVLLVYQFALSNAPLAVVWLERGRKLGRASLGVSGLAIAVFTVLSLGPRTIARASGPTLVFGGDLSLGRGQHGYARQRGYEDAIGSLTELKEADLAVANLECVVATRGERRIEKDETASYYFRGRPEMLTVLETAGIDAVSTANNHSLDYGVEALEEERRWLDAMNVARFGDGDTLLDACKPVYRWVGDVAVALFAVDSTQPSFAATADRPGICHFPLGNRKTATSTLAPLFAQARKHAHLVFVATHWGPNLKTTPSKEQERFGKALIDAGADAILGSSAHKVLGIAVHEGRPIIHGAGDLLFDFGDGYDEGGLFSLVLSKAGVKQVWFTPLARRKGRSEVATGAAADELLSAYRLRSAALGARVVVQDGRAGLDLDAPDPRAEPSAPPPPNPPPRPAPSPVTEPPSDCVVAEPAVVGAEPIAMGPITLLGAKLLESEITKPGPIWVESYWRADQPVTTNYRLRVEGRSASRQASVWRAEHETCDWQWPTDRWQPGLIYRDVLGIRPPDGLSEGTYAIELRMVDDDGRTLGSKVPVGSLQVSLEQRP